MNSWVPEAALQVSGPGIILSILEMGEQGPGCGRSMPVTGRVGTWTLLFRALLLTVIVVVTAPTY